MCYGCVFDKKGFECGMVDYSMPGGRKRIPLVDVNNVVDSRLHSFELCLNYVLVFSCKLMSTFNMQEGKIKSTSKQIIIALVPPVRKNLFLPFSIISFRF